MKLENVWVPVKNKASAITGYLEKFKTGSGVLVSLPGISRWIDGPVLDPSRAVLID